MDSPLKIKTIEVLTEKINRSGIHFSAIAEQVKSFSEFKNVDQLELSEQIHRLIAGNIKRNGKKSPFKNVLGKKGQVKNGFYKIKTQKRSEKEKIASSIANKMPLEHIPISTVYIGKAGEFAVTSQLLFNGFNAGIIAVDEGIDVVAMRNNDLFYFQVKTIVLDKNRTLSTKIKYSSFLKYDKNKTFYIIVFMHKVTSGQIVNDLIIFSNQDIRDLIAKKVLSVSKESISFIFTIDGDNIMLNGKENVSLYLNEFSRIN
ncbi:MAG: hypothetical protein EOM90_04675 [Alphaproteobacteria bacterium]|nr:hypothetical protein [Alphaproteobacteria bacterium]